MPNLRPRSVFVTGASSGIGMALALELAERGARVALGARREGELTKLAQRIAERGGFATVIPVDVADPEAAAAAVREADRKLGGLDMVIANAGVGRQTHASTLRWEEVAQTLDVNVSGAMATLVAAIPILLAHKGGQLVGVTSLAGRRGLPRVGAYGASKAALSTFLETLRLDLKSANIHVTDVQPGFVATPLIESSRNPKPLLWTPERAARVIVRRLRRAPPVIAFPWPMAALTWASRALPTWLYDPIARMAATLE